MKYVYVTLCSFACIFANEDFHSSIPVLDMHDYYSIEKHDFFIDGLKEALREVGFFAVINTGMPNDVLDNAYEACYAYFAKPYEEKMRFYHPSLNGQRGYIPGESAKEETYVDFKEFFHMGREAPQELLEKHQIWQNVWPDDFDLKTPLVPFYEALEAYAIPIQEAFAEALNIETDFFTKMTKEGDCLLRAIHYPKNPPENALWAAEHTDIDLFTILPRATGDGLEVKNQNGEWIMVKVPENAFIVNAGDMLENISNGEFRSSQHRVRAQKSDYDRFSIVFFIHPRSSDRLDPIPSVVARSGGIQKYANATRLELLEERLVDLGLASRPMMQHLAESGLMERLIEKGRASKKAMLRLKEEGLASDIVLQALEKL